jgi:hypothetical protein
VNIELSPCVQVQRVHWLLRSGSSPSTVCGQHWKERASLLHSVPARQAHLPPSEEAMHQRPPLTASCGATHHWRQSCCASRRCRNRILTWPASHLTHVS